VARTQVQLPIRDIRNANPAWLRSSEGLKPLDPLIKSLDNKGMLLPVLIRPDFVMLDGARRLLAAEKLGWTEVPVIVANSWPDVRRYYDDLAKIEKELPGTFYKQLGWREMDELWSVLLKPVHHTQRMSRAITERKRRAKLRQQGLSEPEVHHHDSDTAYTGYVTDLADMFQIRPIHVKLIRDIFHSARILEKTTPEFRAPFEKLLRTAENLGVQTSSTMRQFTRNVRTGTEIGKAVELAEHSLSNSFKAPWRRAVHVEKLPAASTTPLLPTYPVITREVVQNLTKLLEQLSMEAARFYEFEPQVNVKVAQEVRSTITSSVNRINAMRRRLEAHGNSLQGERSE
jgi:hypothetical protein